MMTAIADRSRMSTFAAGEAILDQGQPSDRIGILVRGTVKVVHLTEEGDEQVLQLLSPGDMIGNPFGDESGVSWEAATEITLCSMPQVALDHLGRDHPALYRAFLSGAMHELEEQRLWTAAMRGRSTLQRLAFWLGRQPLSASDHGGAVVEINLSRRDLASLLDMSVETLCRSLHQIEHRGAIRLLTPDRIAVLDRATLGQIGSVEEELTATRPHANRRRKAAGRRLLQNAAASEPSGKPNGAGNRGGGNRHV